MDRYILIDKRNEKHKELKKNITDSLQKTYPPSFTIA